MKKRSKKILIYVGIGVLIACLFIGTTWAITAKHYNNVLEEERLYHELDLMELDEIINQYTRDAQNTYVLAKDLEAGTTIQKTDIKQASLPSNIIPKNAVSMQDDLIGKVIKIKTLKDTVITKDMIYAEGPIDGSQRKEESEYIKLPLRVKPNDVVDVRIVFPNGEDYIVVSKKKLDDVDIDAQQAFFKVVEEEIMLLRSALVDAYINYGELYMMVYSEPEMQPKPLVTYVPNRDVLNVIAVNPQIVDKAKYELKTLVRSSLDSRLEGIPQEDRIRVGADYPSGSGVFKRVIPKGAKLMEAPQKEGETGYQAPQEIYDVVTPEQVENVYSPDDYYDYDTYDYEYDNGDTP